jgi:uncharacterized protein
MILPSFRTRSYSPLNMGRISPMAFTNYILQSVICTTIFYGHGFGLFGQVSRVTQFETVVSVWIFQMAVAPLWMRHFRFGPLEWVWRSATYGRREPFRRLVSE